MPAGSQREKGRGASTEATRPSMGQPYADRSRPVETRRPSRRCDHPRRVRCRAVALSVQIGLLLAFVTALMSVLGFLLKHRGAVAAPPVEWRRPLASTIALFRSPVYAIGCVVATTSWGFHVAALSLAPISLVQSVIAGGLVLRDRARRPRVRPRRDAARVDRRGADRGRARVPRRHARGHGRRGPRRPRRVDARALRRPRDRGRARAGRAAGRERTRCWPSRPACCGPAPT